MADKDFEEIEREVMQEKRQRDKERGRGRDNDRDRRRGNDCLDLGFSW